MIVGFATRGEINGHHGVGKTGADLFYPVSATSLESVSVCFIDLTFFEASLKTNQPVIDRLLHFYAVELQESEKKMRNLAHMQVKGRVAHALLALQDKFGVTGEGFIRLTLSRQDLASFTGTTYETVFRIINELLGQALISVSGKDIRILQPESLRQLTREATGTTVSLGH